MGIFKKKSVKPEIKVVVKDTKRKEEKNPFETVAAKEIGKLDMVIAFDTTGSMASYIGAVRKEVSELIPRLFRENGDLRLGIVAFGDYCDMVNAQEFGKAYQSIQLTSNENELIRFVRESQDTSGGDGDEFYELVLKRIIEETEWREGSTKVILLIADAVPHKLGYSYGNIIVDNRIDWREEAKKAASMKIKVDTVTITDAEWFKELSAITNGVSSPFCSGYKTARLVEAAAYCRGSESKRKIFDAMETDCDDEEMKAVFKSYKKERMDF